MERARWGRLRPPPACLWELDQCTHAHTPQLRGLLFLVLAVSRTGQLLGYPVHPGLWVPTSVRTLIVLFSLSQVASMRLFWA